MFVCRWFVSAVVCLGLGLGLVGCAVGDKQLQELTLTFSAVDGCGAFSTVTYRGATESSEEELLIMAGDQPSPGYRLVITDTIQNHRHIQLSYRIQSPPTDRFYPQVITRPCISVDLPLGDWETLAVSNQDTEQTWRFKRSGLHAPTH